MAGERIVLGFVDLGRTTDLWVGTPDGPRRARQVKRMMPSLQYDKDIFTATLDRHGRRWKRE